MRALAVPTARPCRRPFRPKPSLTSADWSAVWLTFQLATVSTVILLLVGTPIAWWLARTRS